METKKLTRSQTDRWLAGVCGGLGEYFGIDPTVVRLGYLVLTVISGFVPFTVIYIVAAIVMPNPLGALSAAPPPTPITAEPAALSATSFVPPTPAPARTMETAPPPGDGATPTA